jgi:hypothetical protein
VVLRPAEYLRKYEQKKSRQAHVMKYGGGIWGRRCCGGGCEEVEVDVEVVVGVVLNKAT